MNGPASAVSNSSCSFASACGFWLSAVPGPREHFRAVVSWPAMRERHRFVVELLSGHLAAVFVHFTLMSSESKSSRAGQNFQRRGASSIIR